MFKDLISTPVNPVTQEYINLLSRPDSEPDLTLTLLGLACFKKKVEKYTGIYGTYGSITRKSEAVKHFIGYENHTSSDIGFSYYIFRQKDDENYESLTKLGFKHKETVENIVKSKFENTEYDVLFSQEKNSVIVLTDKQGYDLYHLTLSFLPLYYPNIYKKPITKDDPEVKVLSSLSKVSCNQFKESISAILSEFAPEFYRVQIGKLFQHFHRQKIDEATNALEAAKRRMDELLTRYVNACRDFRNAVITKEGVLATEESAEWEEDLISYLCSNKQIRNVKMQNSWISFTVATTLQQFSTDAWDVFKRNGGIYKEPYGCALTGAFADENNRRILFDSIFSEDAKFEVKIAGNYIMDIRDNYFETNSGFNYERVDPIYENYLPNPHLKLFGCLGQYHARVVQALDRGDVIPAFELCVFSAGSVDLDETEQTFRPFLGWIMQSNKKILRRYDGVDMTPGEALVWLIDNKEKDE